MKDDLRWFASTPLTTLVIPGLRARGFRVALDGDAPARAAICLSAQLAQPAWQYARRTGTPLVYYLWDLPPWRLADGRPDLVLDLFGHLFVIPRPWGRFTERPNYYSRLLHTLRRSREIWVPSHGTAGDARRLTGREPVHVPYCYDSVRFTPAPVPRDPRTVVAVSRLVPSKAHTHLLQAAAMLDPMPRVRIIGRGTQAADLRQLVATLGVPATIETDLDDVAVVDAYRRATVVACPSLFEGFGLTGVEAFACGAPVVASELAPHREFLGEHARYFPPGDVPALAAALAQALSAPPAPAPDLRWLSIEAATERFATEIDRFLAIGT